MRCPGMGGEPEGTWLGIRGTAKFTAAPFLLPDVSSPTKGRVEWETRVKELWERFSQRGFVSHINSHWLTT